MSKIYNKYLELKQQNPDRMYLFKCGNFYIFLKDDCEKINDYVVLKKVSFCKDVLKCGFPINSLDDYMRVFKKQKLDIEIIDEIENVNVDDKLRKMIEDIDLENITPVEAFLKLKKLKEYCHK